jgi:hypothetical protein
MNQNNSFMDNNSSIRDGFIFYRSFYESIKELPKEIQAEVITAIIEYGLNGLMMEDLSAFSRSILSLVKPQIDANNRRFANGKKGGRPAELTEIEAKNNLNKTKVEPKNNLTVTKDKPKEKEKEKDKEKVNVKGFPNMPLPRDCEDLPAVNAGMCKQLLKYTKGIEVSIDQVNGLWPVFLSANATGKKFYSSIEDVRSHFQNWIKEQKFEKQVTTLQSNPGKLTAIELQNQKILNEIHGHK